MWLRTKMFMSLSMLRSCSGATPNSAARSWTLVLTTHASIRSGRLPAAQCHWPMRDPVRLPPGPAASPIARRSLRHAVPASAAPPWHEPAGPPCQPRVGWRLPPRPRTSTFLPAIPCGPRPPRPRAALRDNPARGGPAARSCLRAGFLSAVLIGELRHKRHELVRSFRRHPRNLRDVLPLEVENVVERLVTRALQDPSQLVRETVELAERHLACHFLFRRQGSEQRTFPSTLQPFATGVQIDLPAGKLRSQPNVLTVTADGQRQLVFIHHRLNRL